MQIYSLIFGSLPFTYLRNDYLVEHMIHLVGKLPGEWQPKWKRMQLDFKAKFGEPDKPDELKKPEESKLESLPLSTAYIDLSGAASVLKGLTNFTQRSSNIETKTKIR